MSYKKTKDSEGNVRTNQIKRISDGAWIPFDEVLVDNDGTKSIELGAIGVPETYFINSNKKIIKKFIGPLDQEDYENIINLIKK